MAAISFSTCATVSTEEVTGGSTAARARASTNASGTARPADPADPGATVRPRVTTGATFAVPAVHTGLAPHARSPGTTVARAAGSTAVAAIAAIATDTGVAGGARRTCAAAHTTRTAGTTASARRAVAAGAVVGPPVVVVAAAGALDPNPTPR